MDNCIFSGDVLIDVNNFDFQFIDDFMKFSFIELVLSTSSQMEALGPNSGFSQRTTGKAAEITVCGTKNQSMLNRKG